MEMLPRYQRNLGPLTPEEQNRLRESRVCVIGCGGIGGYLIEHLGRIGVGHITAVDGDCFDVTNLNRQLLSTEANIGCAKALAARKRMEAVNPTVEVTAIEEFLTEENAVSILQGHDVVIDALDSISLRLLLQEVCAGLEIPLVHGAVDGWFAQVCTVLPGQDLLSRVYPSHTPGSRREASPPVGTLPFVTGLVASVQVSEAIKLLLGKEPLLTGKILFADLLTNQFDILAF